MQLDIMSPALPLAESQELARRVEEAGFGGLYFTEGGRTAYLSCAAAGLATQRITIGTAVALAFTRSPMVTAQIAWELADLTGGRFVLGLGTQVRAHIERRYGMEFSPPGPRMAEHLGAIKECFRAFGERDVEGAAGGTGGAGGTASSEAFSYEGEFVKLNLLPAQWNPGPIAAPEPPVYLSAVLPYMCRLVGRAGDGIHIHPFHSPEYIREKIIPEIEAGVKSVGRSLSDVVLEVHTMTAVGDSKEEIAQMKEHARTMIAFYGTTPAYAPVFEHHGFENMTRDLRDMQKAGKWGEMGGLITDEVLQHYCVICSFSELAGILAERYSGLAFAGTEKTGEPEVRILSYSAATQWAKSPETLAKWAQVAPALHPT